MGTCRLCGINLNGGGCNDKCCKCCNNDSKRVDDMHLMQDMRWEVSAWIPPTMRRPNYRGEPVRRNLA